MEEKKDPPIDKSYQVDSLLVGLIRDVEKMDHDDKPFRFDRLRARQRGFAWAALHKEFL